AQPQVQSQPPIKPLEPVTPVPEPKPNPPAQTPKPSEPVKDQSPKSVNINIEDSRIAYIALLQGADSKYGYKRKFLTKFGQASKYSGAVDSGSFLEIKYNDNTKKYFKATGRTISGVEEVKEDDIHF
ncbi:MAG: hypothetical protein ACP5T9_05270, partial [Thermoplasmata archaeon]